MVLYCPNGWLKCDKKFEPWNTRFWSDCTFRSFCTLVLSIMLVCCSVRA